ISPFIPFPNISWWAAISGAQSLYLDQAEHFQKMTYRNRYYISGANGIIQLSIPLIHGRNQRAAMKDIQISNKDRWQVQHWRTLVSVYRRSPYFDHYENSVNSLFKKQYNYLLDFNIASIRWLKEQIKMQFEEQLIDEYIKVYDDAVYDLRKMKPRIEKSVEISYPEYYQVFKDRTGFLPNLSMLDLLFSEGPYTHDWVNSHKRDILKMLNGS